MRPRDKARLCERLCAGLRVVEPWAMNAPAASERRALVIDVDGGDANSTLGSLDGSLSCASSAGASPAAHRRQLYT